MDENKEKHCPICDLPWTRHIIIGIMVFLGAFAAFYVVADWHFQMMMSPAYQMKKMERHFMKDQHMLDRAVDRGFEQSEHMAARENEVIHLIKTDDNYQIIIDLSAFDNSQKNVEVKINGDILSITGAGVKNTRSGEKIVKFSQSYMFGKNVDLNNLTKKREGDLYIVTIPIED